MFLLDQHGPKSTRQVAVGSVGRAFCLRTKLVADRRLVSFLGCAVVTLWLSSPCGAMDLSLAFLALCEAVNQHLLSAEWAMAGAETGLTTASGKNCPSSQLLCPCRGWEGFLSYGAHQLRVLFTASAAPETFHRGKALGQGEAEFSRLCSHWDFIACNL